MGKVYYNQLDPRWKNHPYTAPGYPNATTGSSGCGPTCAAMVVSSCKETIRPDTMCDISKQNGFRVSGGTSDGLFTYVSQRWGIELKRLSSSFEAHQACKEGYFVVICCGSGLWTTGGHYILAVGANDTEIEIYDPYLYSGKFNRSGRAGKVRLVGNSAWVEINTFKASSNARTFFAFKVNGTQPQPTPQPETKTKYVNTSGSNLNVRNAPNGGVIGSLARGTQVTVYSEQNGWSQIGSTSWVSSQYLSDTKPGEQSTTKVMYVKTSGANLNIRNNPNGSVVGSLKNGSKVTVLEENSGWSKVGEGQWVSSAYLTASGSSSSTPSKTVNRGTVGKTKSFKGATKIYAKSNLSGTVYDYKAGTSVVVQQNVSSTVDKVKVKATGRVGYVNINSYK